MALGPPVGVLHIVIPDQYQRTMTIRRRALVIICVIPLTFLAADAQRIGWTWPGPLGQDAPFPAHSDDRLFGTRPCWCGLSTCLVPEGRSDAMHVELPGGNADTVGVRMNVLAFEALRLDSLIIEHHACTSSVIRLRVLMTTGPLTGEHVLADTLVRSRPEHLLITGLGVLAPVPPAEYAWCTLRLQPIGPVGEEWVLSGVYLSASAVQGGTISTNMDVRLSQFPANRPRLLTPPH